MTTVDTAHAKLIAAELINLGLGFTVDAKPNTTERLFVIHAQGRDNLIREIAAVVAERLARAEAYKAEGIDLLYVEELQRQASAAITEARAHQWMTGRTPEREPGHPTPGYARRTAAEIAEDHALCTCQHFPGKPKPDHHHPQCPAYSPRTAYDDTRE